MSNPSFMWFELMTTDTEAAAAFYGAVVGWSAQSQAPGYTTFHVGAANGMGGMAALSDEARAGGARPMWMGYMGVPDVDDYARRVTAAGGSVKQAPAEIPGIGRFAPVTDPSGAPFLLFKGNVPESPPSGAPGEAGYVGWRELMSGDGAAAWDFYSRLFGWKQTGVFDMGGGGPYRLWAAEDRAATGQFGGDADGGMMTMFPGSPGPVWNFYFNVDGVEAAAARITAAGGKVINGPMSVPSGNWIVQGLDPQGAVFSLVSLTK